MAYPAYFFIKEKTVKIKNFEIWRVHTPNLLKEIANCTNQAILLNPIRIFGDLLYQVGKRAEELNDEKLNELMMRLTIYSEADPESNNYSKKMVDKYLNKRQYEARKIRGGKHENKKA